MARQTGLIKLKGKIGDLSFYKTKDGHLAREKGGVEGDRIANDPAFIRTRENNAEFGSSASSGKLLRDALRPLMQNAADNRVVARLTKVMTQIKNMDPTSARGQRNVGVGIADPSAKALLNGFNFNNRAILGSVLYKQNSVDLATGVITISNVVPINDLNAPAGATHVTFRGAWVNIDFTNGISIVEETDTPNMPIDTNLWVINLTPAAPVSGTGINVHVLMIEFFQEVNGTQYTLKNGAHNALCIIEVN